MPTSQVLSAQAYLLFYHTPRCAPLDATGDAAASGDVGAGADAGSAINDTPAVSAEGGNEPPRNAAGAQHSTPIGPSLPPGDPPLGADGTAAAGTHGSLAVSPAAAAGGGGGAPAASPAATPAASPIGDEECGGGGGTSLGSEVKRGAASSGGGGVSGSGSGTPAKKPRRRAPRGATPEPNVASPIGLDGSHPRPAADADGDDGDDCVALDCYLGASRTMHAVEDETDDASCVSESDDDGSDDSDSDDDGNDDDPSAERAGETPLHAEVTAHDVNKVHSRCATRGGDCPVVTPLLV